MAANVAEFYTRTICIIFGIIQIFSLDSIYAQ